MNNRKSFKIILSTLALLVILVFTGYYFLYKDIKSKNEHVSILLSDISREAEKQVYLTSTEKIIKNLDSDIVRINNSFVRSDEDVKFIEDLESRARKNGLTVEIDSLVLEDGPKSVSEIVSTLKVRAKVRGSWAGNFRFLKELELLPIKIKIDKFSLSTAPREIVSGEKQGIAEWQNNFEISVLKYK